MAEHAAIRVFLVDDVGELRALLRLVLEEDRDIEVVGEAGTGHEAVERVADAKPDVVLLDLSMPDLDGLEAIPLMRERAPEARIVVLSGHEAGRVSLEALHQGAMRYLTKASDFETIRSAVREVAATRPPFTDERFDIVHRMWSAYFNGAIDDALKQFHPEMAWRPYAGGGRELHSAKEARSFMDELEAKGWSVDPRPYAVEPRCNGLMVTGTLEIHGPGGLGETKVYWVFCFREARVWLAAGFDDRQQATETIQQRCGARTAS